MKRGILAFVIIAVLSAVIYAAVNVRRVGGDEQAVLVDRGGGASPVEAGVVFLRPGQELVTYPVGDRRYRVPENGAMALLMRDGSPAEAAYDVAVSIPRGTAMQFYSSFSSDFESALRRLVTSVAEIEAARTPPSESGELLRRVADGVSRELAQYEVAVSVREAEESDARSSAGLPASVAVDAEPPVRLVVVGVDGGDWLNIRPLVDAGKLPNFRRLLEGGATGPLRSIEPMLSPLLWTTMATGKYPEDHGILNFTVVDPETQTRVPITRLYRKVDAFWNMLSDYDRTVGIVGWLATDPAERVDGVMVTDKVGYLAYAPDDTSSQQSATSVYPPEELARIAGLVVHGRQMTWEDCRRLIHIPRDEFEAHRDIEFDPRDSINNLILLYASTRTFRNIALDILERDHPDLLAVYFEFVDAVSHLFMLHAPPRLPDVSEGDFERFRDAVEQAYVIQDEILGEFMERLGENGVLMVVSDHGFKAGESRLRNRPEIWAGNAANWHRTNGIIAFYGAGVRRGFEIREASILDVAPTILALQGLPRAADMPGKVLATAFESDLRERFNPNTVSTLQRERDVDVDAASGAASAETMKKLEALGYLAPDNADAHNNLGQRYQERGDYLKAIEEYRKALAMRPDFHSVWNNLAVCYGKLKRYSDAEEALRKAIEIKPDDFYAMNNLAVLYMETGQIDLARQVAERCVATEPGYANGHVTLGSVYATAGDLDRAEERYREALRLDPENQTARVNLGRIEQQKSRSH